MSRRTFLIALIVGTIATILPVLIWWDTISPYIIADSLVDYDNLGIYLDKYANDNFTFMMINLTPVVFLVIYIVRLIYLKYFERPENKPLKMLILMSITFCVLNNMILVTTAILDDMVLFQYLYSVVTIVVLLATSVLMFYNRAPEEMIESSDKTDLLRKIYNILFWIIVVGGILFATLTAVLTLTASMVTFVEAASYVSFMWVYVVPGIYFLPVFAPWYVGIIQSNIEKSKNTETSKIGSFLVVVLFFGYMGAFIILFTKEMYLYVFPVIIVYAVLSRLVQKMFSK